MPKSQFPKINLRPRYWKKYSLEFLSIFVAVIAAFALNNWNDYRKEDRAESKILLEISNGLEKDEQDIEINIMGHKQGLRASKFWRGLLQKKAQKLDSLPHHYLNLTRDFVSVQNTSGYETLKSRGFELIENDSLRSDIISLYEFDYQTLRKLEEEYNEIQFQENYFRDFNRAVAPHFVFDEKGNITGINTPFRMSESEKKILLSYLWKIDLNRRFIMHLYEQVKLKIQDLRNEIERDLEPS